MEILTSPREATVDQHDEKRLGGFRADAPADPTVFRRGDEGRAEPAVPAWTTPGCALFE